MNRIIASFITGLLLFLISCTDYHKPALELLSHDVISHIPSASGVYYLDGSIWMVGDDAIHVFQVDKGLDVQNKYQISALKNTIKARVDKSLKADFESMDYFDSKLIMLGSGSKAVSRDTAVIFDIKERRVYLQSNIRSLFNHLMEIGNIDTAFSINIEGLASDDNYFYLLHRGNIDGNNNVYRIQKKEFLKYLQTEELPAVECYRFQLPEIDGYLSGFSGACVSKDGKYLIITSSVEATADVYHDGEVLGSFMGYIPLQGETALKEIKAWPLIADGKILKTKLESLSIIREEAHHFELLCVSDNDNGQSGVYRINMKLKE